MEGLLPYVYRAIVQYRCSQRLYGALASPAESGRFSWESAYIRLPGDSGRFASEIHELLVEALPSSQIIYSRSASQSLHNSNHGRETSNNNGQISAVAAGFPNANVSVPPAATTLNVL